jgi:tRNA (adenine37-N6)-methyltransferase
MKMRKHLGLLLLFVHIVFSSVVAWCTSGHKDGSGTKKNTARNNRWDMSREITLFQTACIAEMDHFDGELNLTLPSNSHVRDISTLSDKQAFVEEGLHVKPIGVIRSVYKLCVGTPRQGLLAPNARGYVDLFALGNSSPASSVNGLEEYSHIWIIFIFHLNTQAKNASRTIKSKITPPALGGDKVGIYATRTPHRYNPIGMTLCRLDRIEKIDKRNVRLHISGLDLVDGTPVLDIKPHVPVYDSVAGEFAVPHWVERGLSLRRSVTISRAAQRQLEDILTLTPDALHFYGVAHGEKTIADTMEAVLECIRQVLSIDVRSSFQTEKSRSGRFKAERSNRLQVDNDTSERQECTQQLDNLLVHFEVGKIESPTAVVSEKSGAEDLIVVTQIELLSVVD